MTNSIVTTEQELKELLEKGFFVRVEPVKKGERLFIHKFTINDKTTKNRCIAKGKTVDEAIGICEVGEVFSVKNKKGEKQWWCPKCGFHSEFDYDKHSEIIKLGEHSVKPLLVRLDKIEEQQAKVTHGFHNWLKTFRRVEE